MPDLGHCLFSRVFILQEGGLNAWGWLSHSLRVFGLFVLPLGQDPPLPVQGCAGTSEVKLLSIFLLFPETFPLLEEHLPPVRAQPSQTPALEGRGEVGTRNLPAGSRWIRAELRFALHGQLTPGKGPHQSLLPAKASQRQGRRNEAQFGPFG